MSVCVSCTLDMCCRGTLESVWDLCDGRVPDLTRISISKWQVILSNQSVSLYLPSIQLLPSVSYWWQSGNKASEPAYRPGRTITSMADLSLISNMHGTRALVRCQIIHLGCRLDHL